MRQWMWIEFLKDYEFDLKYHPGKGIKMAGAFSIKEMHATKLMMLEHDL